MTTSVVAPPLPPQWQGALLAASPRLPNITVGGVSDKGDLVVRSFWSLPSIRDGYAVLITGQNEYFLSKHHGDMIELWRAGRYIPLDETTEFHRTVMIPK